MYLFATFPQWVIAIFSFFCLIQVMTLFQEMRESIQENNKRFFWMGQRFDILPNNSFIVDESLKVYGIAINKCLQLN